MHTSRAVDQARRGNWIGGEWISPSSQGSYREPGDAGAGTRASGLDADPGWARATQADWRNACLAAQDAGRAWNQSTRLARAQKLRPLVEHLEGSSAALQVLDDLGLDPASARSVHGEHSLDLRLALELAQDGAQDSPGLGLFQAHWSDACLPLAARVLAHLVRGRAVIVCSHERLPRQGAALAQALEALDLPRGLVSMLHGTRDDSLKPALGNTDFGWARLCGLDSQLGQWGTWAHARLECHMRRVANRSLVLEEALDAHAQAGLIYEQALAPVATLSGQAPGQVARVLCPKDRFSLLTEELLALLERCDSSSTAVPALDSDLADYMTETWELGLDEGAAPIFGRAPAATKVLKVSIEQGPGPSLPSKRAACPAPILFTNVEPHHSLVQRSRPAPILSLVRVASSDAARELARHLDGARDTTMNWQARFNEVSP